MYQSVRSFRIKKHVHLFGMEEKGMDFSQALYCLKDKKKVQRESWGEGVYLAYQESPAMLVLSRGENLIEPDWQPSMEDMMEAEDWQVVE